MSESKRESFYSQFRNKRNILWAFGSMRVTSWLELVLILHWPLSIHSQMGFVWWVWTLPFYWLEGYVEWKCPKKDSIRGAHVVVYRSTCACGLPNPNCPGIWPHPESGDTLQDPTSYPGPHSDTWGNIEAHGGSPWEDYRLTKVNKGTFLVTLNTFRLHKRPHLPPKGSRSLNPNVTMKHRKTRTDEPE